MKIYIWFHRNLPNFIGIFICLKGLVIAILNIPVCCIRDSDLAYNFEYLVCIGVSYFLFLFESRNIYYEIFARASPLTCFSILDGYKPRNTRINWAAEIADRLIQQNELILFRRALRKKLLQDGYCCQLYVLAVVYNMITD